MIVSLAHHQKIIRIACSPEVETETENFFRCDNKLLSFPDLHKLSHPLQIFRDAKRQEKNCKSFYFPDYWLHPDWLHGLGDGDQRHCSQVPEWRYGG